MKDFESKLSQLEIPTPDEDNKIEIFNNLNQRLFNEQKSYLWQFRITFATSIIFACVIATLIIKPTIAEKSHQIAFNKQAKQSSKEDKIFDEFFPPNENMQYTSIYNPVISQRVDPSKYVEDKAYLIRKYKSQEDDFITIISEFDNNKNQQNQPKIRYTNGSL